MKTPLLFLLPLLTLLSCASEATRAPQASSVSDNRGNSSARDRGQLTFAKFEGDWLLNHSAEPKVAEPRAYLVRSEEELRDLPLNSEDVNTEAFRDFDFSKEALVFVIHPEQASSSRVLSVKQLAAKSGGLMVQAQLSIPESNCMVTEDIALIVDVIRVSQYTANAFPSAEVVIENVRRACS